MIYALLICTGYFVIRTLCVASARTDRKGNIK